MYPASSVAEDSGVATNNESANEKPSSRKRSAREIAQLYEQLKSKHIQRKREWNQEREMLLARCKATENSQQVLRNVRGILEQLRSELKREESRRNDLEKEFSTQHLLWGQEQKTLHEEIFELQRTERMWLEAGNSNDSRVFMLHKKVQELRNEKLVILKNAETERLNWEDSKIQMLNQLKLMSGAAPVQQSSAQTELNNRLDNALEQIESVSRQLCSVQDQPKPAVGFVNHLGQTRQMSSSTSRLDELSGGQRPKSSFDLVRRERGKEYLPSREILSDAADITTDEESRHLPGLHKNTTIKKFDKSVIHNHLLFGNRSPAHQQRNGGRGVDLTGINGPIPYHNGTTQIPPKTNGLMAYTRPDSAKNESPMVRGDLTYGLNSPMGSVQSTNLRSLQSLSLSGTSPLNSIPAHNPVAPLPTVEPVRAKQQPMELSKGVRFANPIPVQKTSANGIGEFSRSFNDQRAFDSDDGAAKTRREQRMRRFKMLEARRGVPGGETTDDGGFEDEPIQRSRRSKKYTRSKTDTSAAEMKALTAKAGMGHRAPLGAPLTYGAPNFTIDKPKVLRQFEKKLMENENKATCKESNGLIERNLTGATNSESPVRVRGSQPSRRSSDPHHTNHAAFNRPDQRPIILPKSKTDGNVGSTESNTSSRIAPTQTTNEVTRPIQPIRSNLSRVKSRFGGSTPNLSQTQQQELDQPNIQKGFDCTAADRAHQLRVAREQIELDKVKRTESLKQRISMFEANRQKALTTQTSSPNAVNRTQSLKMAPTFVRDRSKKTDQENCENVEQKNEERKGSVSDSLAGRRSMVAGILSAGPPKKTTAKKYKRADTLPIESSDRTDSMTSTVDRPPGPANRRLPSRWRSGKPSMTDMDYDFSTID